MEAPTSSTLGATQADGYLAVVSPATQVVPPSNQEIFTINTASNPNEPSPAGLHQVSSTKLEEEKKEAGMISQQLESVTTVRVSVTGNVDSGKTTLTGILAAPAGVTDDGRGALRDRVFNFAHEKENGRTTSIGHEIIGFDLNGQQVTSLKQKDQVAAKKKTLWPEIVQASSRVVQLIDLCGHEKYLKTTMFGLSSLYPHYNMLVVGANMGVSRMTKEHIGITQALKIPMFVVVTKIDLAPPEIYNQTVANLSKILKGSFCNLKPIVVKDEKNLDQIAEMMPTRQVCPIFSISNVSSAGIDVLKTFFAKLPLYDSQAIQIDEEIANQSGSLFNELVESEFIVDSTYNVKNVGFVVGGTLTKGEIQINSTLMMGPDKNGTFKGVIVKGIQENRVDITECKKGQTVTLLIKSVVKNQALKFARNSFKKGVTLLGINMVKANQMKKGGAQVNPSQALEQLCVREFEAEVVILHHATTIKQNYQAVVHCAGIRQSATAIDIDKIASTTSQPIVSADGIQMADQNKKMLNTGDKGLVRFRFSYYPEILKPGSTIMFREGRTKGLGYVTRVFPGKT